MDDVKQGNYIDLLDPDQYDTVTPACQVRRQRINDNLLGDGRFCPTIRRTDILQGFEAIDLPKRCRKVVSAVVHDATALLSKPALKTPASLIRALSDFIKQVKKYRPLI
ncbi:hypothetical protein ACFL0M_08480 [Thermodesulfobacteriota bacterium]